MKKMAEFDNLDAPAYGGETKPYYLSGGPFNAHILNLESPGTLHIKSGNFAGRYIIHPDPLRVRTLLWLDD